MRVISKFKDYYDFIGNRYGADPGVVYMRGKIPGAERILYDRRLDEKRPPLLFEDSQRDHGESSYYIEYIVVGDLVIPVLHHQERYRDDTLTYGYTYTSHHQLLTEETWLWVRGNERHNYRIDSSWTKRSNTWDEFQAKLTNPDFQKAIVALVKDVGHPVFRVKRTSSGMSIDENTPILQDMGVPSLVPPQVMWQKIYTTLVSVLRTDPDKAVPVTLDNNARIEKAGFNLKSSFRHPVNKKNSKRS